MLLQLYASEENTTFFGAWLSFSLDWGNTVYGLAKGKGSLPLGKVLDQPGNFIR